MKSNSKGKSYDGLHVQWPWSRKLLSGEKTVETRGYPLPVKHIGKTLALIETLGKKKPSPEISETQIIALITFSECFQYKNEKEWRGDFNRHKVDPEDSQFAFDPKKEKWGWVVKSIIPLKKSVKPPAKRGIVFAKDCKIP